MMAQRFKGECGSEFHALSQELALQVAMDDVRRLAATEQSMMTKLPSQSTRSEGSGPREELDSDDELLMNDPELERLRAERIRQLKAEASSQQALTFKGHGAYTEIEEQDFLAAVTDKMSPFVICHFFHREFVACRIMDKHLSALAPVHRKTKFIKLNAENAPFFVSKLAIKVLPTVVMFRDGIAIDRLVGFEDPLLGSSDDCTTRQVEKRLSLCGVIEVKNDSVACARPARRGISGGRFQNSDDSDE